MNVQEASAPEAEQHEHRQRMMRAMAAVAADKGLSAATIADIVREAGVSKRSFYEHFDSKEACFLALYRAASASALRTLSEAVQPDRPWQAQLEHALGAYFSHLAAGPSLLRSLFVEIHHVGPAGMAVRRTVMQQMADFLIRTVNGADDRGPASGYPALTPTMAMAAVGGINELVLDIIERGAADQLASLAPRASEIVRVLTRTQLAGL